MGNSSRTFAGKDTHQLFVVEGETQTLQHGDEDDYVLPVGGDGAKHAGQLPQTLLQRVDIQHHPARASLREETKQVKAIKQILFDILNHSVWTFECNSLTTSLGM